MPKSDIHPKMYEMRVHTVNGLEFVTRTTRDAKGKVVQSDFDTASLPWNKKGLGNVGTREATVQKYQSRKGSALGFGSVLAGSVK